MLLETMSEIMKKIVCFLGELKLRKLIPRFSIFKILDKNKILKLAMVKRLQKCVTKMRHQNSTPKFVTKIWWIRGTLWWISWFCCFYFRSRSGNFQNLLKSCSILILLVQGKDKTWNWKRRRFKFWTKVLFIFCQFLLQRKVKSTLKVLFFCIF